MYKAVVHTGYPPALEQKGVSPLSHTTLLPLQTAVAAQTGEADINIRQISNIKINEVYLFNLFLFLIFFKTSFVYSLFYHPSYD